MTEQALRAALLKLQGKSTLPASQFTAAQRMALDQFARQTGAVNCLRQGRGDVYSVCDQAVFDAHVSQLSPQVEPSIAEHLPLRAQQQAVAQLRIEEERRKTKAARTARSRNREEGPMTPERAGSRRLPSSSRRGTG